MLKNIISMYMICTAIFSPHNMSEIWDKSIRFSLVFSFRNAGHGKSNFDFLVVNLLSWFHLTYVSESDFGCQSPQSQKNIKKRSSISWLPREVHLVHLWHYS